MRDGSFWTMAHLAGTLTMIFATGFATLFLDALVAPLSILLVIVSGLLFLNDRRRGTPHFIPGQADRTQVAPAPRV
ncbi:MAG: hypothetical protein ACR2H9_22865 [Longimicrobiaceae bacterium]